MLMPLQQLTWFTFMLVRSVAGNLMLFAFIAPLMMRMYTLPEFDR